MSFERQSAGERFREIAHEIKKMCEADQDMRERWEEDDFSEENLDATHTERMKEIVEEIGWPSVSMVGEEQAEDAWLLVQHADHDVAFQSHCLELMKALPEDEVERVNIAYLEDRIRVNQGIGQLYGTQFTQEDGKHIPRPIEDEENIDARRAELGLGTLQEQIEHMYNKYPFDNPESK